jgi:hypothetical protein
LETKDDNSSESGPFPFGWEWDAVEWFLEWIADWEKIVVEVCIPASPESPK